MAGRVGINRLYWHYQFNALLLMLARLLLPARHAQSNHLAPSQPDQSIFLEPGICNCRERLVAGGSDEHAEAQRRWQRLCQV